MRFSILILCVVLFFSCRYFAFEEKKTKTSEVIARVNTSKLFKKDFYDILPKDITKQDSAVIMRGYIQKWAVKKLLLEKSKNNSSLEDLNNIENLVKDYRESLLINSYKEQLIKQQLDTIVTDSELKKYYELNKENFKLKEELIKIKYLHTSSKINDKKEIISLFRKNKTEELEKRELNFKSYNFNDLSWKKLDDVLSYLPFSKRKLLRKTRLLTKQDAKNLYLVSVKDVLLKNSIAPLSYIKPILKQVILHKRKIELIKELETILIKDATKNNNFKIY